MYGSYWRSEGGPSEGAPSDPDVVSAAEAGADSDSRQGPGRVRV